MAADDPPEAPGSVTAEMLATGGGGGGGAPAVAEEEAAGSPSTAWAEAERCRAYCFMASLIR